MHKFHRISASVLGTFILFHLLNHVLILGSVKQHIDLMEILRFVYRNLAIESLLLVCVTFQVSSGVYFVWKRRGQRSSIFEKAQAISGLYLAYFLLNHVGAVLFGRISAGLDTNIYYGIAGFHISPFHWYFVPYYFFAVAAFFVHVASAFHWLSRNEVTKKRRARLSYAIVLAGFVFSMILMLGFSGAFSEIVIPEQYKEIYRWNA